MPLHQFHSPPGSHETPGIGETIDNEEPSKAKSFFTDPKNLATMLVLASALAQPRRGGRSALGHTLRGGVGALAFRGGLDQAIHQQAQKDAEQRSIAEARAQTATTGAEAVEATRERTASVAETAEEKLASEEAREAAALAAGKYRKAPPASGTLEERLVLQADKNYAEELAIWQGTGRQGPMPEYGDALLRAAQGAAAARFGLENLIVEPVPEPGDTEDEKTILGGVFAPREPTPLEVSKEGRSSVAQHFIGKGVMTDALEARLLKRRIPEFRAIEEDSGVIAAARQMDVQVQQELPAMTIEEARAALKERRWALSDETIQALKEKIQSLKTPTQPTAPLTEAFGKLAGGQ